MLGIVNVPGVSTSDLANKVDKVLGKGLSTNDFTDAYKNIIDNLDDMTSSYKFLVGNYTSTIGDDIIVTYHDSSDKYIGILNQNSQYIYFRNYAVYMDATIGSSSNQKCHIFVKKSILSSVNDVVLLNVGGNGISNYIFKEIDDNSYNLPTEIVDNYYICHNFSPWTFKFIIIGK